MQDLPDLTTLSHAQKDELIVVLWQQVQTLSGCPFFLSNGRRALAHRHFHGSRGVAAGPSLVCATAAATGAATEAPFSAPWPRLSPG